ncbi:hypothetical protein Golob_025475, partial [Gossypium lobatum]|nr:hypothetical protein [Gossypium lobatum]
PFSNTQSYRYRQRRQRVDIRVIKNWFCQILRGLAYPHCHDPPVIHRDLKCDNIFVHGHLGQVKIGDLGLAAILHGSKHAHSVIASDEENSPKFLPFPCVLSQKQNMLITATMDPTDDTIFLKVQIIDNEGHARNIYFPFDIVNDTAINIASETVKEVEIRSAAND